VDTRIELTANEQQLTLELMEALSSSLELSEVLGLAQGVMSRLLSADYIALCVSKPGRPAEYDWTVTGGPAALLTRYHEVAEEDFVRDAVLRHPNQVLRDSEMLPRMRLERSQVYQRCRELGLPLEHVMAVLLDVSQDWHGGLTLYRERRLPFSDRDRALLQRLTPLLANTVRNCRMHAELTARGQLMDALLRHQGAECLVLVPPSTERLRTAGATALLERWYTSSERGPSGLPKELLEQLRLLIAREGTPELELETVERSHEERNLRVTFIRLPPEKSGKRQWALWLQEFSTAIPLPEDMRRRLSSREVQLVACVLSNWPNEFIAGQLGLTLNTVKTHLRNIYKKLGVESRTDLMYQAAWRRKPF
jgi:DNA-binding CsgD family transcriptional regulator